MNLTKLTDEQLDVLFVERICGWKRESKKYDGPPWNTGADCLNAGTGWAYHVPRFTKSMDAVFPYLEKRGWKGTSNRAGSTCMATVSVVIHGATEEPFEVLVQQDWTHTQTPFPRAAVIAMLRAHDLEAAND